MRWHNPHKSLLMKTKLLIILLFFSLDSFSQATPTASKSLGTLSDLRAMAGTPNVQVLVQGLSSIGDQNGGTYYWNSSSTATDDGFTVVKVTTVTTGRWIRMTNSNTIKGLKTLSGLALQTAYNIAYDNTLPSAPAMIIVQAYSANAAVPSWVSNVTSTGFTVNFASVPILGTNNITITYLIIKQ